MKLSEIYGVILTGFPTFYKQKEEGICIYIADSYKVLTEEQQEEVIKDMKKYRPERSITFSYWWQFGEEGLEKRMKFLKERRSTALKTELEAEGWVQTDASTNQYRKNLDCEDTKFLFREDRIVNPETKAFEVFESEINIEDYDKSEVIEACKAFGYEAEVVEDWLNSGAENALIAECLFELQN